MCVNIQVSRTCPFNFSFFPLANLFLTLWAGVFVPIISRSSPLLYQAHLHTNTSLRTQHAAGAAAGIGAGPRKPGAAAARKKMQSHHHHHHHSGPTATMAASPHQVVSLAAGPSPQDMSSSVHQQQQQQGGHGHIMSSGSSSGSPGKQERPEGKEGIGSLLEIQRAYRKTRGAVLHIGTLY